MKAAKYNQLDSSKMR